MNDEEVEAVAAELARAGGVSWHSGQEHGPLKLVMNRYRERARRAIATLDRVRAAQQGISLDLRMSETSKPSSTANLDLDFHDTVSVGSLVLYRPPGDQRSYPCRVEKRDGDRVYLVPELPVCTGWVDLKTVSSPVIQ
jgi:hypothetical protein